MSEVVDLNWVLGICLRSPSTLVFYLCSSLFCLCFLSGPLATKEPGGVSEPLRWGAQASADLIGGGLSLYPGRRAAGRSLLSHDPDGLSATSRAPRARRRPRYSARGPALRYLEGKRYRRRPLQGNLCRAPHPREAGPERQRSCTAFAPLQYTGFNPHHPASVHKVNAPISMGVNCACSGLATTTNRKGAWHQGERRSKVNREGSRSPPRHASLNAGGERSEEDNQRGVHRNEP